MDGYLYVQLRSPHHQRAACLGRDPGNTPIGAIPGDGMGQSCNGAAGGRKRTGCCREDVGVRGWVCGCVGVRMRVCSLSVLCV